MTKRFILKATLFVITFLFLASPAKGALRIGTDLFSVARAVCGYSDCLARGSSAGDEFGWVNPATLPVGTFPYVTKGIFLSQGEFFGNVGETNFMVHSTTLTALWKPVILQANYYKATGSGDIPDQPIPLHARINLRRITLGAAIDLGYFGVDGLSVGVLGGLPVLESDVKVDVIPLAVPAARIKESRDLDITVGLHYRAGEMNWFMLGAYFNHGTFGDNASTLDPSTFSYVQSNTSSNLNTGRVGVSIKPAYAIPAMVGTTIRQADIAASSWLEMATEVRLGVDYEHFNTSVPGEGTTNEDVGYFGVDFRVIPDGLNPWSRYVRLYLIAGVDTQWGYSVGPGIYPNPDGPLAFISINTAYSSRNIAPTFGDRVEIFAVSVSFMFGTK